MSEKGQYVNSELQTKAKLFQRHFYSASVFMRTWSVRTRITRVTRGWTHKSYTECKLRKKV